MDELLLHEIFKKYSTIISVEDGTIIGGFGSGLSDFAAANHYANALQILGIPDVFIEHGTVEELQNICGIDVNSLKLIFESL